MCWDIASLAWNPNIEQIQEIDLLYQLMSKYRWNVNLYELLHSGFDALVITNHKRQIEWVSKGFEQMTGYPTQEVIHAHPSFLQGENTNKQTIQYIRRGLLDGQPVTGDLINYRKSGEEYLCHIEITPLFAGAREISHFLAVEKEICQ